MDNYLFEAWAYIHSGPCAKHKLWLVTTEVEKSGKSLAELGPRLIAYQLDVIEREGMLLDDAEFERCLASNEDFFGRERPVQSPRYFDSYDEGKAHSLKMWEEWHKGGDG